MDDVEVMRILRGEANAVCKRCGNLMVKTLEKQICKSCYEEMYAEEDKALKSVRALRKVYGEVSK